MGNDERRAAYLGQVVGALLLLVFAWSYWPTIKDIVAIWGSNPDYSHGYFVLPVALWLLWLRRDSFPKEQLRPAWAGLLLIALAAAIRVFAARIYLPRLDGWTIPIWLAGVVWVWGGWKLLRWAAPCIAFLWFMMPLPGVVEQLLSGPLQRFATTFSTWGLQCLAQPAIAQGTTILLDENVLEVERACSGLRIIYGISALAIGYVLVMRCSLWTTVVLLASVLPVALIANAFRVTVTGLMYRYASGEAAQRFSHDFAGFAVVPLAVLLFWGIATCWNKLVSRFQQDRAKTMTTLAIYAVVGAVVMVGVYFWQSYQERRAASGFLTRATMFEEQEEWGQAAESLSRYLRVYPDDHEVLARFAQTYDQMTAEFGPQLRALELYRQAAEALPDRIDLRLRQAELALNMGEYDEASQVAREISDADDDSMAAAARIDALAIVGKLASEGEVANRLTWQQHAVESLEKAVRLNPHEIELSIRLADIYRNRLDDSQEPQRLAKADQVIEEMITANPQSPDAWLARYRYRRTFELPTTDDESLSAEIEADLDRAIELGRQNPEGESVDVLLVAGTRAERREETDQARAYYERAIQSRPTDYRGYLALGQLDATQGTEDATREAVRIWREGLEKAAGGQLALKPPLAAALFALGEADAAEQELQELEGLLQYLADPQRSALDLSISMIRGEAQAAGGEVRQAASAIRQKLTSLPPSTSSRGLSAQYARAWLRLADMYAQLGAFDQAATACARAGDLDPSIPMWREKAAEACELGGRLETAISYYRQVADEDESQPRVWLALARARLQAELRRPADRRNWRPFRLAIQQATKLKADPAAVLALSAEYGLAQGTPESSQRAVEILNQGLQRQPDSALMWRALAIVHERRGELDEALSAVSQYSQRSSDPLEALRMRFGLLSRAGRYEQARQAVEEGLAALDDPQSQDELERLMIQLELATGDRSQAIERLEALSQKRPDDIVLVQRLAELALNDQDWTALEAHEQRLRSIEGEDGSLWRLFRARRLLQQVADARDPRFAEILELAAELETLRPKWSRVPALRGQIASRQGAYQDATVAFQEAMQLGDRSVETAVGLLELLTQQGRFREAEQLADEFREDLSRSSRLTSLATNVYVQQGESAGAIQLAEDWVEQNPDDPRGLIRLGQTILLTTTPDSPTADQDNSRAEQAFRQAIKLNPNDLAGWSALYSLYARAENPQAAQAVFDELAEQSQIQPTQKALMLAQLHQALGNSYSAARHYREAVESADDNTRVQALQRAAQFFRSFDPTQAEDYCRRILQRKPDSPAACTTLIAMLAQREGDSNLREAFELLEQCRGSTPISLHQRLEAALLLRRGGPGDRARAIQMLEELVSLPQAATQDKLRLAGAYELEGRLLRSAQIMEQLGGQSNSPAPLVVAYIEFLQRNGDANPAFLNRAGRELERLRRDPENTLNAFLAVQQGIRAAKQAYEPDDPARQQQIRQHVNGFMDTFLRSPTEDTGSRFEGLLVVLLQEECVEEAVRVCQRKPSVLPVGQTLWHLVVALVRTQASEETFAACESVVRDFLNESAEDAQVLYSAGFFYYLSQQEDDEGIVLLRKALAAAPDRSDVMNTLAFAIAVKGRELDEALELIEKAIAADGPVPDYLDTKAIIMLLKGDVESARDILGKTLQLSPSDPLMWLHLSVAQNKLGKSDEARDAWLQARALGLARAPMSPLDRQMADQMGKQFGS